MGFELILKSVLLGAGLAMDAFSVSLADGLSERNMNRGRMLTIAGTFAGFQFAMPLAGWLIVHTAVGLFGILEGLIPWIALILLLFIGGKMLLEGIRELRSKEKVPEDVRSDGVRLSGPELFMQGVATSIDALSVGFTIEKYSAGLALIATLIIGVVTLIICLAGLMMGRKVGMVLSGHASVLGGVILTGLGIWIWAGGVF